MSGEHTQGRMTWKSRPDGSLIYVIGAPNDGPHAQGDIFINEADLRRIVACWNACEKLPTEALEKVSDGFGAMLPMYVELRAQRDQLLEALRVCEGNIASLLASTHPKVYGVWLDCVRAAIAKATGAACT